MSPPESILLLRSHVKTKSSAWLTDTFQSGTSVCSMSAKANDPITPWFAAAEDLGEYIGIRFGHLPPGGEQPEWIFLRHTDFDGIGGLAELLRRRGAPVPRLQQIKHASPPSVMALIRATPKYLGPRRH